MPQLVNSQSAAQPEPLGLLRHLPEEQLTSLQRLREGEGGHCPTKMPFLSAAQAGTSRKLIHQTLPRKMAKFVGEVVVEFLEPWKFTQSSIKVLQSKNRRCRSGQKVAEMESHVGRVG